MHLEVKTMVLFPRLLCGSILIEPVLRIKVFLLILFDRRQPLHHHGMLEHGELQLKYLANVFCGRVHVLKLIRRRAIFIKGSNKALRVRSQGIVTLVAQFVIRKTLFRLHSLVHFHALLVCRRAWKERRRAQTTSFIWNQVLFTCNVIFLHELLALFHVQLSSVEMLRIGGQSLGNLSGASGGQAGGTYAIQALFNLDKQLLGLGLEK